MPSLAELLGVAGNIPYWVNGTNYPLGKVVRSPADHQLYVRIVAGAGATDPASDATNWRPDGGRAIKSIQRGVITLTSAVSASATISAVNTAKTELRCLGGSGNDGNSTPIVGRVALTSSTTVTAYAWQAVITAPIGWELTEYY